jgi:benzoyl-CoA 2,3-dioxygenase component B
MREDYIEDCRKGVERWNRTLAPVGRQLHLPHTGFNRSVGAFRGQPVTPDGRLVSAAEHERDLPGWLPTEDDKAHVLSLMQPVHEPGRMAGWLAPPATGVHAKPLDFEYVRR